MILDVRFEASPPYNTWAIRVFYDEGERPVALVKALAEIGFQRSGVALPPDINGIVDEGFFKPGSDIFQSWTDRERKKNMAEARAVLARFGFRSVQRKKLGFADLV